MKKCTVCNQTKPDSAYLEGRDKCRQCRSTEHRDRLRTKEGVLKRIYASQKTNSKRRSHPAPEYTLQELISRFIDDEHYNELYDKWVEDGYSKLMKPSLDRIDDSKHYSFDNIQFMTWVDNKDKAHSDSRTKKLSTGLPKRIVQQYTMDMEFVQEFISIREACRTTNAHEGDIISVCKYAEDSTRKRALSSGGFKWRYK